MDTLFISQVKQLYKQFEQDMVFSVLEDGQWTHTRIDPNNPIIPNGTRCKTQLLSNIMDFPKYLETYCD